MSFFIKHGKMIVIVLFVVLTILSFPFLRNLTVDDIAGYTPESLPLAALLLVAVFSLKSVLVFIPHILLYLLAGLLFDPWLAILFSYAGIFCELTANYFLGACLGRNAVNQLMEKSVRIEKLFLLQHNNMNVSCLLMYALPHPLPFDVCGMYCGASDVPYGKYICLALLGSSPRLIPYVLAGGAITDPLSPAFLAPFTISLAVTAILFLIYTRMEKRNEQG